MRREGLMVPAELTDKLFTYGRVEFHGGSGVAAPGDEFPFHDAVKEKRVANDVSFPHPPWFLHDSVDPFDADFAHPAWRAADVAGVEVEESADAHKEGGAQLAAVAVDPFFL